jgi:transcriptional regulator with XRE-family HTH domain
VQPEELKAVFRDNLARRRHALGLSQSGLANLLNARRKKNAAQVHVPYLSDLESGKRSPTLETIAELAEVLDTTPDALLTPEKNSGIPDATR